MFPFETVPDILMPVIRRIASAAIGEIFSRPHMLDIHLDIGITYSTFVDKRSLVPTHDILVEYRDVSIDVGLRLFRGFQFVLVSDIVTVLTTVLQLLEASFLPFGSLFSVYAHPILLLASALFAIALFAASDQCPRRELRTRYSIACYCSPEFEFSVRWIFFDVTRSAQKLPLI
jgi:hypothetical protein